MAGSNTTGQPNTADYNLGRGALYFANNDSSTGLPGAYRHLGNAPEFTISVEVETLEHQSSLTGLKQTDKEVIISQSIGLSMSLDEINFENVALFMSGTYDDYTNVKGISGISQETAVLVGGRWYDLRDANGSRLYDIDEANATVELTDTAGAGVGSEDTDYTVDYFMGRIFILDGLTADGKTGLKATVTGNSAASTNLAQVDTLTQTTIAGSVKFISENPVDGDHPTEYQFHQVSLKAEGDFSLIGDDFTVMQLTGKAEKNTGTAAGVYNKTLTITTDATW